jgi:hypothetical protein
MAAVFRSPSDFYLLAKWIIASSIYRGVMCWLSYFTWARNQVGESGAYLTQHDDTVCWVVAILALIVDAVQKRSAMVTLRNLLLTVFFLGAVQFNNRRLAWVAFALGLVLMYALFPPGRAKQRINRVALALAPLVLLYIAVGWGSQNLIFLPLRSLSSVSTQEDSSTLARNAENLGLISTVNYTSFFFGAGWGRPYAPVTMKYDISGFELWQYIPHNSILGVLAFSGVLGFAGFWLAVPTAVFLNARVARLAGDPKAKSVGIVGAVQLVVAATQLYGDMGIFFVKSMFAFAISYAIALRLPVVAGVWPTTRPTVPTGEKAA